MQETAKKCTKSYNARAQPLFCSLNLLFGGVLVAVAVVFCVRSLLTNKDTVNRMVSYVKMLSHRKTRQVFLDALKVLGETIDIDGWATAAGDTVDLARCLAGKSLLDENRGSRD